MQFNKILKELRSESGLTQTQLAQKANLATSCIAMLETNKREPTANTLIALSCAFNVSTDYLLGLSDDFGAKVAAPMGDTASLTEKEKALLKAFKNMLPETQDFVLRSAQSLSEEDSTKTLKKS